MIFPVTHDFEAAKRRNAFAALLFTRPASELKLLLEREPHLIDLQLAGAETVTEYQDVIKIILNEKTAETLRVSPKSILEMRLKRASQMVRAALTGANESGYMSNLTRSFLSDLLIVLDG